MKKDYMAQLERWARWYLPRTEAGDVIADYRDIIGNPPRSDEELLRDLGKPRNAVKPLAQPKQYCAWLAVFTVMAACLLLPASGPLPLGAHRLYYSLFFSPWFWLFLLVGIILPLTWFRPQKGEKKTPLPRSILIILAVLLVFTGFLWWVFYQLTLIPDTVLLNPIFQLPPDVWIPMGGYLAGGNMVPILLAWSAVPLAVVGITGLVKARVRDRRWRAVYVLSLSALLLALRVESCLSRMDPSAALESQFAEAMAIMIEITAAGLLGTGVALC